jgi:aldehyde dehydrogenase
MVLMDLIGDLLPAGRAEHRQRLRRRGRQGAGHQPAHRQDRVHRLHADGSPDHAVRRGEPDPVTVELGGKSPNIFFATSWQDDDFFRQGHRGLRCSPSSTRARSAPARRAPGPGVDLRPTSWSGDRRVKADQARQPARSRHMVGAQASKEQYEKILSYIDIGASGRRRGADRRRRESHRRRPANAGYYVQPTVLKGTTRCASSRKRSSVRW